jgi:hypothetical protein
MLSTIAEMIRDLLIFIGVIAALPIAARYHPLPQRLRFGRLIREFFKAGRLRVAAFIVCGLKIRGDAADCEIFP